MLFDKLTEYFLPTAVRSNKAHPRYDEFRVVASSVVLGAFFLSVFPLFLLYIGKPVMGYYVNVMLLTVTAFSMKLFSHYRIPMTLTAVVTYFILYDFIKPTGLIFSPTMGFLHMYLLAAVWVDKRWGWWAIISNILLFSYIYYQTIETGVDTRTSSLLGSPIYALVMHCFISLFLGIFLAYEQFDQDRNRKRIKSLQDNQISMLDEAVKKRTDQLNNMRQVMATDFHDETGNMLSAITRQASVLKLKLHNDPEILPIVESIIKNSDRLYASSKDFLWNLHHNSDDPAELFNYLTAYGQYFYNQFDIAFSPITKGEVPTNQQLDTFAALNLIFIFKEAMTNVVKHANAKEVIIEMAYHENNIVYSLHDNGSWKYLDDGQQHYGLKNIEKRCRRNLFSFQLLTEHGTRLEVAAPVHTYYI